MSTTVDRVSTSPVGQAVPHESAALHVTGAALYTDDLVLRTHGVLHAYPVQATLAHARVTRLHTAPALGVPGVVRVLTGADVPGVNDAGVKHDEPLFPTEVMFLGHAVAWVLAETLEAARLGAAAVEVDYEPLESVIDLRHAIAVESFQGAAPRLERGDIESAFERAAHVFSGEVESRGPGALLPRDPLRPRAARRVGTGLRPEQHAAPERDPGDRRPRARGGEPRGDRAVPADGRGLRGQGDAAARSGRCRRPRQPTHRAAGSPAAQPDPGPHDDGQAARLPHRVAGGFRRRRSPARARCDPHRRRRVEPRPVGAGPRPGALPRRQRLLDPRHPPRRPGRPHAQDLADGVPRLRRAAGHARHRGHPRTVRPAPRDRPDGAAPDATSTGRARRRPTASRCATPSGSPPPGTP